MIDRILSVIIAMGVIILLAIFLMTSVFLHAGSEATLQRHNYEYDYGKLALRSVLLSYENESGTTYESLLIKALQGFSTQVTIDGKTVDVEQEFSKVFDELFGPGNYYLSIKPALMGVSVSYILDGSPTMAAPRQFISQELPNLVTELEGIFDEDANLFFHVYLLDDPDNHGCLLFNTAGVECEYLYAEPFYDALMTMQYDPEFEPPYPDGILNYQRWLIGTHFASTFMFTASDWASGSAYASLVYHQDPIESASTNAHIIVTIADEMTTSSKADSCFTLEKQEDVAVCILCDNNCPVLRAQRIINQTRAILQQGGDRFIGFHTFPVGGTFCNLKYNPGYTNIAISEYICQYLPDNPNCPWEGCDTRLPPDPTICDRFPQLPACECYNQQVPPADIHWCRDNDLCGGCTPPGAGDTQPPPPDDADCIDDPDGCFCYLQDCTPYIYDDLQELANATDGDILELQYDDLSMLTGIISQYVSDQIASFNFTLGTRQMERDRYVYEDEIRLLDGKSIDIVFWVYE